MPNLYRFVWLFALLCSVGVVFGQKTSPAPAAANIQGSLALYEEIRRMDSIMFSAFNRHDTGSLMSCFSPDLEFYHDKGGLSDFEKTKAAFAQLFDQNRNTGLRRDLVPGSLEVFPIPGYGAVETCQHRFCHIENDRNDCGTFKNVMIWKKTGAHWKVTRVISFDH